MFTHVVVGANDIGKAKTFYDAVFAALGVGPGLEMGGRLIYAKPGAGNFMVTKPINGEPATHANGGTIGFAAESAAAIDAWHAAGCANGGQSCESPPGVRELGPNKLYLAYLRDPDGNKLCAMHPMAG